MTRYRGTITSLENPKYGFIGLHTITRADGRPIDPQRVREHMAYTESDVFVHDDNLQGATLKVGLEVVFRVQNDQKREKAFRALLAEPTTETVIEDGVELHFDQPFIDHPTVPIRWCIKPETFERMKQNPTDEWALIFVSQSRRLYEHDYSPIKRSVEAVVGVNRIGLNHGYFTFPAPGTFELVGFLIRIDPRHTAMKKVIDAYKDYIRHDNVWDVDDDEVSFSMQSRADESFTIEATAHVSVAVPDGIFAKPLPKWMKSWLGYFDLERPRDECSMRGRIVAACTLGLIWWMVWETLKRSLMIIYGFTHFIVGGNPLVAWREVCTWRLSGYWLDGFFGKDDFEPLLKYRGWKRLLHPTLWLAVALLTCSYVYIPDTRELIVITITATVAVVSLMMAVGSYVIWREKNAKLTSEEEQQAEAERLEAEALRRLTIINTHAMCGTTPQKQPTNFTLVWTGIKRKVCRAYA